MLRLSLRSKMLTAFSLVVLPLLLFMLAQVRSNWNRREESMIKEQLQTARTLALQLDAFFDSAITAGWAVANDPLVQKMDPKFLDPHLRRLVLLNSFYLAINVFDLRGDSRGWGGAPLAPNEHFSIADQPQFKEVLLTNRPVISKVLRLRRYKKPGIAVEVPIRNEKEKMIGVVSVVILAQDFSERFGGGLTQEGPAINLFDPEGGLAFDSKIKDLQMSQVDLFRKVPELRSALAGNTVVLTSAFSPVDQQEKIEVFTPSPKYHWVVGSSVSRKVIFGELKRALGGQIAAVLGILLLSGFLAVFLARKLAAPVLRLKEHAALLGQGKLDQEVSIQTGDELELLGKAFNEMSHQMQVREQALSRGETQYRRLVETAEEGIWTIDANQITTFVNPKMARMLGYTAEEILGKSGMSFASPLAEPMHTEQMENRKKGVRSEYDIQFIRKDGTPLWTILSAAPIYDEKDEYVGSLGAITDITERKKNEEELRRLAEENARLYEEAKKTIDLREEFLSIASHELKTPLTPLKIQLQLLKRLSDQNLLATFPKDKLAFIVNSGEHELGRLVRLVEDLLDVSRIQSGQLQLSLKEVNFSKTLEDLAERFRPQFAAAGCSLTSTIEPGLIISADPFRLEQIITNLFTNAVKYGARGPVSIFLKRNSGSVRFELRDEGIGIAEKDQTRIFSRFERAVSGKNFGGLGLGLYITHQLVTAHQGKIQVESQLGKGSLFRFELPVHPLSFV